MKDYLTVHPWKIIEEGFHPEFNKISESIFSLGNGRFGQRGNFEEYFSGTTLQGNYVGGIYYPDKTVVGWWKNGYPQYYAKVPNSANWNFIDVYVNNERLDLAQQVVKVFRRTLDMKAGLLARTCIVEFKDGVQIEIESERINSLENKELGLISYKIRIVRGSAAVHLESKTDFDVRNENANYDENFWYQFESVIQDDIPTVSATTKKTEFQVTIAQITKCSINQEELTTTEVFANDRIVGECFDVVLKEGQQLQLEKYVSVLSSFNHEKSLLEVKAKETVEHAASKGYAYYKAAQEKIWESKWNDIDIKISGDDTAQQSIRFNIFQLHQTYTGEDDRLNIGPKGFTGEKYGGSTYWDTEAYCIPFYLSTAEENVTESLLIYRYKQLGKAIENAEKLGIKGGAALYPMVTMNGEECHNEWEITFEEIHRNGAIAYAIFNFVRYTGKTSYLAKYGLEVLIAISRFWANRIHYSDERKKYVLLGVTGPNEYENNVNNNWYTNYIATWTLRYTIEALKEVKDIYTERYMEIISKTSFHEKKETEEWKEIIGNMYYPYDDQRQIFLQQDNYLDKEQILVANLLQSDLPLNQNWSWDRILRSCFIKQADVLQGLFFFEKEFDVETIRRNFLFYEPRTVHESSLSPCVHSIIASKLDFVEKAYEMYLRTARLDLNDYNNDTQDGLHITSMAGTWMSVVMGFGGMRVVDDVLTFDPKLPKEWEDCTFKVKFRQAVISVFVSHTDVRLENLSDYEVPVSLKNHRYALKGASTELIQMA